MTRTHNLPTEAVMHNKPMSGIAVYRGASGRRSLYPIRDGATLPASITTPSGEVRQLVAVETHTPCTVVGTAHGAIAAFAA